MAADRMNISLCLVFSFSFSLSLSKRLKRRLILILCLISSIVDIKMFRYYEEEEEHRVWSLELAASYSLALANRGQGEPPDNKS